MFAQNKERLINTYEIELKTTCIPGSDRWNAKAQLGDDIRNVLPYLNAELKEADYDRAAEAVIWEHEGRKYAFRPLEICVAPVTENAEAEELIGKIVERVNDIWDRREEIEPSFERVKLQDVMSIYMALPRTNCGECGYLTCMAFAAEVRKRKAQISDCPHIPDVQTHNSNGR